MNSGLMARYGHRLPLTDRTPRLTLGEGSTPLVPAPHLSARLGREVFLKLEGSNPTGSFKDRGMFLAVAKAIEDGAQSIVCASTGNTSASAAAYAARAGLACFVLIPDGAVALGKLAQAMIQGARVFQIAGNFDRALTLVKELGEKRRIAIVNSINPFRIEGQKTIAFEVIDALGDAPDLHFLPVGNAGNITAHWRGYREAHAAGEAKRLPHMMGFQAEGASPIVRGAKVEHPETVATAIRIGDPASWQGAIEARDASGGHIGAVSDAAILEAWQLLASREGIFCEPASAAGVAGLLALHGRGALPPGERIVCTLTGHGLKDPDLAIQHSPRPARIEASYAALEQALGSP